MNKLVLVCFLRNIIKRRLVIRRSIISNNKRERGAISTRRVYKGKTYRCIMRRVARARRVDSHPVITL